jgi:toxin ParE1/3/4
VKPTRLVVSDLASADILEQADWYEIQSGALLAQRWENAVTSCVLRILKSPNSGTPCAFKSAELKNLRRTTIAGFPKHLIFYRLSEGELHVLRIVHGARDLERLL